MNNIIIIIIIIIIICILIVLRLFFTGIHSLYLVYLFIFHHSRTLLVFILISFLSDPVPYNIMYFCIAIVLNKILFKPNHKRKKHTQIDNTYSKPMNIYFPNGGY